jgi:hypothetical protein
MRSPSAPFPEPRRERIREAVAAQGRSEGVDFVAVA